jgi:hypothetical protein
MPWTAGVILARGAERSVTPQTWTPHGAAGNNSSVSEEKRNRGRPRLLGGYLLALCLYQIGIYRWPGGPPFILDPRAGIPVLLINHFSFTNEVIYPVEWVSAGWLAFLAGMILVRGKLVKLYLVSECVLAAPTAYYIAVLIAQRGGHFAPGLKDVALTLLLFLFFSIFPIGLAVQSLR